MSRSTKVFILCVVAVAHAALVGDLLRPQLLSAQTASPQIPADPRAACAADVQRLCPNVPPGGGTNHRLPEAAQRGSLGPLQAGHRQRDAAIEGRHWFYGWSYRWSRARAGRAARHQLYGRAPRPSPAAQRESHPSTTTASGPAERYFLMKQVKIIDQGLGQGRPAYDLMIPTTWQFKGWVNVGAAEGGCFADWFAVVGDAKSADNSIEFQMLPQYTWQYIDDPAGQRQMQMQNQRDAQVGMKPCPVRAPIPAAEFLRQDLIAKYRKGKTVVSIDPFPELDQIVRYRLGLPPTAAGGSASGIRTDAARARLAYDDDKGQPVEEWIAAAIVVRSDPHRRPRGSLRLARRHGHVLPDAQRQARCQRQALQADREHHSPRAGMAEDGATGLLPLCIKRSSRSWRSSRR